MTTYSVTVEVYMPSITFGRIGCLNGVDIVLTQVIYAKIIKFHALIDSAFGSNFDKASLFQDVAKFVNSQKLNH